MEKLFIVGDRLVCVDVLDLDVGKDSRLLQRQFTNFTKLRRQLDVGIVRGFTSSEDLKGLVTYDANDNDFGQQSEEATQLGVEYRAIPVEVQSYCVAKQVLGFQ